jgi:hypothetical protein
MASSFCWAAALVVSIAATSPSQPCSLASWRRSRRLAWISSNRGSRAGSTTLVASWAAKIGRWLKDLLASLNRLRPIADRLGELINDLKNILNRLRGRAGTGENGVPLQRVRGKGAGPKQPMNMESVRQIAAKYEIDISHLKIDINKGVAGRFGRTRPDGSVELCRTAFQSEEDLARTLEHERFHSDELASGKPYPKDMDEAEPWEDRAYAHEDEWWQNHPVRPEGAR